MSVNLDERHIYTLLKDVYLYIFRDMRVNSALVSLCFILKTMGVVDNKHTADLVVLGSRWVTQRSHHRETNMNYFIFLNIIVSHK